MQFTQALIVMGNKILLAQSCDGNKDGKLSFPFSDLENREEALKDIREKVKKSLGIEPQVVFKFNREGQSDTSTYLMEAAEESLELEHRGEISRPVELCSEELIWVPIKGFGDRDILTKYLILLYGECIDRNYNPEYIDDLERVIATTKYYSYGNYAMIKKRQLNIMESIDSSTAFSEKAATIIISLLLGLLFDYFFTEKEMGVSVTIFTVFLIAFFFWSGRKKLKLRKSMGWFLLIAVLLLSLCFSLYSNPVLMGLNILLMPALMVASSILLFNPELKWDSVRFIGKIIERGIASPFNNFLKPFKFIGKEAKSSDAKKMSTTRKNILKGLFISLPLLLIIIPLLTSADMVFGYYLRNITGIFDDFDLGRTAFHLICVVIVFLYLFSYIWNFKYTYRSYDNDVRKLNWEPVTVMTIIFIINIVYLLFTMVQFTYLYGGGTSSLPQSFTYAEYARKGFFELVAVTIINFAVLLVGMSVVKRENKALFYVSGILLTLLILFTFSMLYSANYKMSLYEESYGYTYLRVFVHYFMLLLLLLLLTALVGIWYKGFSMPKVMIVTTLVMYVVLNFVNVDAFIVKKNIERYRGGAEIDVVYLTRLSYDAAPYLKELASDSNEQVAARIKRYIDDKKQVLNKPEAWSEFNYSKNKARKALNKF